MLTSPRVYAIAALLISACSSTEPSGTGDAGEPPLDASAPDASPADAATGDAGTPPPPEACPRAPAAPVLGDVNGDGVLDIADPIALENHLFRGGPAPVCAAAADFNNDGHVEEDDATLYNAYLFSGTQRARTLPANACTTATPWPAGQCAPLGLELDAPARTSGAEFQAVLGIRSPTLRVAGWSMSFSATGCTISGVTTDGTAAAEIWDQPPGLRHLGYSGTMSVQDGAVTYVILSSNEDIYLPNSAEAATPVLRISVHAEVPASGCMPCALQVTEGLRWMGQPINAAIVADGYAYLAELPAATIDVCAP